MKAFVKVPVLISPRYVSFRGYEGDVISLSVTIKAMEKKPLELEPAHFNLAERVTYNVEVIEPGKIYKIHFKNKPAPAGIFNGVLQLKTNYPEKSEITIPIRAKFRNKVVGTNRNRTEKTIPKKP
jgi:hypothetical protein